MKKRDLYYERIPTKLLREDIRLLGTFLGRVIKDQEGPFFFKIVERLRLLSKNTLLDKNKSKVFSKISKEVKKLSPEKTSQVIDDLGKPKRFQTLSGFLYQKVQFME